MGSAEANSWRCLRKILAVVVDFSRVEMPVLNGACTKPPGTAQHAPPVSRARNAARTPARGGP